MNAYGQSFPDAQTIAKTADAVGDYDMAHIAFVFYPTLAAVVALLAFLIWAKWIRPTKAAGETPKPAPSHNKPDVFPNGFAALVQKVDENTATLYKLFEDFEDFMKETEKTDVIQGKDIKILKNTLRRIAEKIGEKVDFDSD